ncbi:MAG: hypothetical protein ACI4TI_02915, partial [Christensenellales bacterium]
IKLLKHLKQASYEVEYENDNESERNETILYCKIKDKSDVINPYSSGEDVFIRDELSSYLQQSNNYMELAKPINIRFDSENELTNQDKDEIKLAIRNHFTLKVSDVNEELYSNKKECFFMISAFILFLSLFVLGKFFANFSIISEIFSLVSWVFGWDFVESIAFVRPKLRKEAIRLYKLLNARIEFSC